MNVMRNAIAVLAMMIGMAGTAQAGPG